MIIAVDFDGVLCENNFPDIGAPHYNMISFVRQLIDEGHEVILWTSRVDDPLIMAVDWCHDRGLHFCAVNDNAPSNKDKYGGIYPNGTRKVYADIYLDDNCPWFKYSMITNNVYDKHPIDVMIDFTRRVIRDAESKE